MAARKSRGVDYIVVGAGSAGCVVASRLSEDRDVSVLLLEAGGRDSHPYLRMPLAFLRAAFDPRFNWGYVTEPEPHLGGRRIPLPRGKVLGGSSSINGMFYMRGHPRDYDLWRQMGCTGWGYADLLPYFKRSEASWRGAGAYHGGEGPLAVNAIDTSRLLHEPLMAAAAGAGYTTSADINGAQAEGFARGEVTIDRHGRRASTARAYLRPALARTNLAVEQHALTTRIVIAGGRAGAVEYRRNGQLHRVAAEREIILCGGTYNSPQLLLLSGIGPADELRGHGIAPALDLPGVGRNLSEHPSVLLEFAAAHPVTFLNELRLDRAMLSVLRWAVAGSGAFASQINSCNVVIRTAPGLERPDIQLLCNPIRMDAQLWFPGLRAAKEHRFDIRVVGLHPESRGVLALRSADPADPPRITLNLFAAERDLATMRRGLRAARAIYRTEPQARLTARETAPGADIVSDADLDAYIRRVGGTCQHPVGTCAMGSGPDSVVDPELRVRGLAGLRVADASIMQALPGGNTNAPAIMIGEKAADLILGRRLAPAEL